MNRANIASSSGALPQIGALWAAYGSAHIGDQVALIAIPLFILTELNGSARDTALLTLASTLPAMLLAIPLGVVGDRFASRTVLALSEVVRALSLVVTIGLVHETSPSMWSLAALAFLGAGGTVAFTVVTPTAVSRLVRGDQRLTTNNRLELARSVAISVGPAFAGALCARFGAGNALWAALAWSVLSVAMVMRIGKDQQRQRLSHSHPLQGIHAGFTFVRGEPTLRTCILTAILFNISWFALMSVFVAYCTQRLQLGSGSLGAIFSMYGVGMVVGSLALPWFVRRLPYGTLVCIGPICGLIAITLVAMTLVSKSIALPVSSFFLLGAGPIMWTVTTMSIRQEVTPPHLLSRVSGFIVTATAGARPIGAAVGFISVQVGGYELCIALALIGFLFQMMFIIASPLRQASSLSDFHRTWVTVTA